MGNVARREMSTDPRAVRTRATLINSTIGLLKTNRAETLSVSQIVKEGKLSRQVFYEHFADRDALLYAAGEKMIEPAFEWSKEHARSFSGPEGLVTSLFTAIEPHREAMRNLCDGPVHWRIHSYSVGKLIPFLETELRANLERSGAEVVEENLRPTAELLANGVAAQLTEAVREGRTVAETRDVMRRCRATLDALRYDQP